MHLWHLSISAFTKLTAVRVGDIQVWSWRRILSCVWPDNLRKKTTKKWSSIFLSLRTLDCHFLRSSVFLSAWVCLFSDLHALLCQLSVVSLPAHSLRRAFHVLGLYLFFFPFLSIWSIHALSLLQFFSMKLFLLQQEGEDTDIKLVLWMITRYWLSCRVERD